MNKLPDREILLDQFEQTIGLMISKKMSKNPRQDTLAFMAALHRCSIKELKEILFN